MHTVATSRCSECCWRRTESPHCQQAETSNLLIHDNARATKGTRSIGSAVNQGRSPGEVEIDLPEDGTVEGSERLRGSEKESLSYDYYVGKMDCI
jgi:hypothetical protein